MYCIPKHLRDEFFQRLKSGNISPDKLLAMTSQQRREFFAEFMGEHNAQQVNLLLEKNLILKDQQRGLVKWAEQVAGLTPDRERDLLSRIEKMEDILTPESEQEFLEDLAGHKLGVNVTMEEAANITEMARIAMEAKDEMDASERRPEGSTKATDTELKYGRAVIAFDNYISALKQQAKKRSVSEAMLDTMKNPVGALKDLISGVAGTAKTIVSSVDNSFIGRQGIQLFYKGLTELPQGKTASAKTWLDTFSKSFKILFDTFKGKPVMDEMKAIMVSDPDYHTLKKARVAIGTIEEEFPITWPERVPIFGKVFEASDNAFSGAAHWMRYRVAKTYLDIARKTNVDLTDRQELEGIGKLVNSITSRGDTGAKSGGPGVINNVFWSPKMIKGALDVLTAHQFDKNITPFVRKQAAINLLEIIVGTGMVLAVADLAGDDDEVEWDTRSANFGKIKVGNTRFSVNPFTTFITLASRILVPTKHNGEWGLWSKSSTTGKFTNLLERKFGQNNAMDVFEQFLENKTAPLASEIVNFWKNQSSRDWTEEWNWRDAVAGLTIPMSVRNAQELLNDPGSADIVIGMITDGLGISTNTYSQWSSYSDTELREKLKNYTKKDKHPMKGKEDIFNSIKEEQRNRYKRLEAKRKKRK